MLFRQMQYLVALSIEGHFGRAAERCHVSQPSLSSAIKQMEHVLGVPIVMRGVVLSDLPRKVKGLLSGPRR